LSNPSLFPLAAFTKPIGLFLLLSIQILSTANAQGTRLLRQPTISDEHIAFVYGGDIWIVEIGEADAVRLTSTAAVETHPHFSPDGSMLAFTSDRSGSESVYTLPIQGGSATRLTWHPSSVETRGWSPDGEKVLFASTQDTAPSRYNRLWTVPLNGEAPSLLAEQWGFDGSFSEDGDQIVIDRMSRWDSEWRAYRGGQNTSLRILNLNDLSEIAIPNESTTDVQPLWLDDKVYFLSDRDWTANVWTYSPRSGDLEQVTEFSGSDIKHLAGNGRRLVIERDGYLHTVNTRNGNTRQLEINVRGDFPWAQTQWEDVSDSAESASLSPTGQRAIMSARGEVFTVPIENGDTRNITKSSGAADRAPLWSPSGDSIAWFSDGSGDGYELIITSQDGFSELNRYSIGESKMAWEPTWSPDGEMLAFVDDDVRIRVINMQSGALQTVDVGGNNLERGANGIRWSPDSQWLAYSKTGSNGFGQLSVWSRVNGSVSGITDTLADAFSPAWDRDGEHLYFLASTDLALASGWANTSSSNARPEYSAYVINLVADDDSPFKPRSDEEEITAEGSETNEETEKNEKAGLESESSEEANISDQVAPVIIDFEGIERRTLALSLPPRNYRELIAGPEGNVFIAERPANSRELTLHKFTLEDRESKPFTEGVGEVSVSADGAKMLVSQAGGWKIIDTSAADGSTGESIALNLRMRLDRQAEWAQIFEEAWRYERDYFYDPDLHGRDWDIVYERYAPLVPFIKHRSALSYVLDQMNGELSVGHSFVFGGDFPDVEESVAGLLGADLIRESDRWKIGRIYTAESWNPDLTGPLDQPGLRIQEGYYLVGINGEELTASNNPYAFLDGTVDQQTVLHINDRAEFEGAWQETVIPIASEFGLRQRTWVEDNRRRVDELSEGKLAYIWVPNTGSPGLVSFNRYFFGQQDKAGAVIDERFNGGGLLDDYMVDLMNRSLRAGLTNEVPNGVAMRLPAGILGPKVLLVNELAGSGGDFFPWIFQQLDIGPLVGSTTWGGLVKSSVHYSLVDGGALTAPDNAVFDPNTDTWVAENVGVVPDIAVYQDALSLNNGDDPQLQRAVLEALRLLEIADDVELMPPSFPTPALQ
jgi:tricorn protease